MTRRDAPWFVCVPVYTVPIPQNRWGQDRQNFISVYHDEAGVIVVGGNTKLQPLWSTFTVGDTGLLAHTPGEEELDFGPVAGLTHCPEAAVLGSSDESPAVELRYGDTICRVEVRLTPEAATLVYTAGDGGGGAVAAHVSLVPRVGEALRSAAKAQVLGEEAIDRMTAAAETIAHAGWALDIPAASRVRWPVLPHNPYRKDGAVTLEEARLVVSLPLEAGASAEVVLRVGD